MFVPGKTGTAAALPTAEKKALSSFNFFQTRTISTNCKEAKTDKFNFGQLKAKHDLPNKALQRTD